MPRVALTSGGRLLGQRAVDGVVLQGTAPGRIRPGPRQHARVQRRCDPAWTHGGGGDATVVTFESVGSILVIAMLVVPAAAASLLTRRLHILLAVALVFAALSAVMGHIGAITLPRVAGRLLGQPHLGVTSSAAMMAVCAGMFFLVAWLIGAVWSRWRGPAGKQSQTEAARTWQGVRRPCSASCPPVVRKRHSKSPHRQLKATRRLTQNPGQEGPVRDCWRIGSREWLYSYGPVPSRYGDCRGLRAFLVARSTGRRSGLCRCHR